MIQRRAYLNRAPLKRGRRKKRPEGWDDPAYLEWIRRWPCYVCLRMKCRKYSFSFLEMIDDRVARASAAVSTLYCCGRTEAAHIGQRGLRQKCKDREAMPLGQKHHLHQTAGGGPESHHSLGVKFWNHHGLERDTVMAILNDLYHRETGK